MYEAGAITVHWCVGSSSTSQAVFETNYEYYSPTDLQTFQRYYGLTIQSAKNIGGYYTTAPNQCSISGSSPDCFEGNLDLQYIMGVAQNVATTYWYVSGSNPFLTWVTDAADELNPPLVNSISWASIEQSNSASTMTSFYNEAVKLAAMGVTVLVSSGDDGVANFGCSCYSSSYSYANCACQADSSSSGSSWSGASTWTGKGYFPSFPASCPYVTAVGGTMGAGGAVPSIGAEIASQVGPYIKM
jgi:tripeptidyl-peptidase-1